MASYTVIQPEWIDWIRTNYQGGADLGQIREILISQGLTPTVTDQQISVAIRQADVQQDPSAFEQLRKLEAIMAMYTTLRAQCQTQSVPRESNLEPEQFFRWYYAANTPVVLTGQMATWPALEKWNPDYFETYFGSERVEVMAGRNADPAFEINSAAHKTIMPMTQFVNMLGAAGETNDFYMVANNRSIESGTLRYLLDDIRFFDGILDPHAAAAKLFLWFGPAGTVTPLHYDVMNVLLAQVLGRKKVTLIPSFQTPYMYNKIGVYSQVNFDAPDYLRYPLFQKTTPLEVLLEPGEALFIPVGWWHHVRSVDVSISVSFINFAVENSYQWETK